MEVDQTTITGLTGQTIIISPSDSRTSELATELERSGSRVIASPTADIAGPDSYAALDEAISNLYGYDWIIFTSVNGAQYFLSRLNQLGHEVNKLDELRVCAIGEATNRKLAESRVHVDIVSAQFKVKDILAALEAYTSDRESLRGLNFLVPRAAVARNDLSGALEAAGARADTVAAYRTVRLHNPDLARINALLAGGGIDCIAFTSALAVRGFAELFDTNDLSELLSGVAVACIDQSVARAAAEFGLCADIMPAEFTVGALARTIEEYFRSEARPSGRA